MTIQPSPNQSGVQAALRSFLVSVLPGSVEVIAALDNRVPEPEGTDFVLMTTVRRQRFATNYDTFADVQFTASIAATTLTVSAVKFGTILVGATVFGTDVTANTAIVSQLTGTTGGVGTYQLSISQSVSSETMASGAEGIKQETQVVIQLDFHSANTLDSSDMAQTVSTLMRDDYAVDQFANQSPNYGVVPIYADDPKQMPFINDQQQIETRWIIEATLQSNPVVAVPQQFADAAVVGLISVDEKYPP